MRYRRWLGKTLKVDTERLTAAIISDGRPRYQLSVDCGFAPSTVDALVARGTAKEAVLDTLACALGMHMSQLEAA